MVEEGEKSGMQRYLKIVFALIIALFTMPLDQTVFADTQSLDVEDGEYTIDVESLHAEKDEKSGAANFIGQQATLTVQEGKIALTITIPNNEMAEITGLQVKGKEPKIEKDDKAKYFTYELDELTTYIDAKVQYEVPSMGMKGDEPFRFHLKGLDDLPVKKDEPEESNEPEDENNNSENEDNNANEENNSEEDADDSIIKLEKGYYTINVAYLKNDSDEKSSMGSYLKDSAFLSVKDGKVHVTLTVNDDETVTKLQVNEKSAVEQKVEDNIRYETFELVDLSSKLDAYVEYQAPYQGEIFEGHADFRVSFDEGSLSKANASDKPGAEGTDEPDHNQDNSSDKPDEKNKTDKNDSDAKNDNKKEKVKNNNSEKPNLVPDKVYEIDYVVKHESEDTASAADHFFLKPAHLLYKDGEKYLQLTVTNSDMIKSLSTANGDVVIVKENPDGSMVIQFKVDGDLSDVINLNMFISVPDMPAMPGGYDMEHNARLFLDPSSLKEVNASNFLLAAADNGNGPTVKGEKPGKTVGEGDKNSNKNDGTPKKPEFGTNDDNNGSTVGGGEKPQNPKTGDTSGILLYTLLLIGSLIPLAMKFKRRFV